jgi:hypothetical protein
MNELLARWIEAADGEWGRGEVSPVPCRAGKTREKKISELPLSAQGRNVTLRAK